MAWVKKGGRWVKVRKKSIGMVTPSNLQRRRESFERKKLTLAFKRWRKDQFAKQKGVCYLCKAPMLGIYSVDHIKPLALGGTSKYENLALCHIACNRRKGIQTHHKAPL